MSFKEIETKWQKEWEKAEIFEAKDNSSKKKFYALSMYAYPSASGLHMGHASNYTITDVFARYKLMNGFNVLHPVGYDSFGLPAENAAINEKSHPKLFTEKAIQNFMKQQKALGLSYDWSRMFYSHDPHYYKWNQLLFIQMYKKGLAYKKLALVNWCPKCNTVLANEQVVNGKCWRHDSTDVELKELNQWFFKISDYSNELLKGLDKLDWPEEIKQMQRNWIGKSEGTEVSFKVKDSDKKITVFTTRIDTIYGVSSINLAPENPLVLELIKGAKDEDKIKEFMKKVMIQDKTLRTDSKEKDGIFLGKYAMHPLTNKEIPIYIANFVLPDYGGGAVMCVPAHDQRDFEFAKKFKLDIIEVIKSKEKHKLDSAYTGEGTLINSGKFNKLTNKKAITEITKYLKTKKLGKKVTQYKLRDWLISRQRYWGTPIPIIYCNKCGMQLVDEDKLPVTLPTDAKFTLGGNPLETSDSFRNVVCPKCKGIARRETDTMDTFVDSSWYFLRFTDPHNDKEMFSKRIAEHWMPIDLYVGGKEHATGHLIYCRFITKVLRDFGLIKLDEPAMKLFNQGMLHKNGVVMSKSKGNVVTQDEIEKKYGIDTARFFLLSISSPEKDKEWSDKGIEGSFRIIKKILPLIQKKLSEKSYPELDNILHKTIKNVTESIENLQYNLSTIYLSQLIDLLSKYDITKESLEILAKLLSPFTPHVAEELWEKTGNKKFVSNSEWPSYNKEKINPEIDAKFELVDNTIRDIKRILSLIKDFKPSKVVISVAEGWKYDLIKELKEKLKKTREIKKIMSAVMIREHATEISKIVPNLIRNENKIPKIILSKAQELKTFERNKELIQKETGLMVEVTKDDDKAMPFKPSIRIS